MTAERDLLRLLGEMPCLDRLEAAALSGWSRGAVYAACAALGEAGLVAPLPHAHASELVAPAQRYALTVAGLHRLAGEEGADLGELLRSRPLTAHWRRLLLERLDGVASIYRLAAAITDAAWPLRFRWYRAMPMDAAIALPDGRTVFVVREGRTADRTSFAKRLWRLREGPRPGAYLLLVPDTVRLRHTARLMAQASVPAFLALERDAAAAGTSARTWRTASGSPPLSLREVLAHVAKRGAWPEEEPLARTTAPRDLGPRDLRADWMLPTTLGAARKRALGLVADWPWLAPADLGALLGVSARQVSQLLQPLQEASLVARVAGRLVLRDRGLALLARRDRSAVNLALRRWSARPLDREAPLSWRNVAGRRSRQLLRTIDHTAAVHGFVASLTRQACNEGWEVAQLDPPHRASRYFRHRGVLHSVHPDAFGVLRREGKPWAFFLEWERRAVRPSTMAARLAPYLRYYASQRPTDDHGVRPTVLVVFEDDIAADHFLRVARKEIVRARIELPLRVSHRALIEREGPLGHAWRSPAGGPPVRLSG